MRDSTLRRCLHFLCAAPLGAVLGAAAAGRWTVHGDGLGDGLTARVVAGAVLGALLLGGLAAWRLEAFWAWWADRRSR